MLAYKWVEIMTSELTFFSWNFISFFSTRNFSYPMKASLIYGSLKLKCVAIEESECVSSEFIYGDNKSHFCSLNLNFLVSLLLLTLCMLWIKTHSRVGKICKMSEAFWEKIANLICQVKYLYSEQVFLVKINAFKIRNLIYFEIF